MKNKIPRLNEKQVRIILNNDKLTIREKAQDIYYYNYNKCCLETDGKLPDMLSARHLEEILKECQY